MPRTLRHHHQQFRPDYRSSRYQHADRFADHHLGPLFLPESCLDESAPTYHNPHVPGWSIHRGALPSLFHPHYVFTESDGVPGTVYGPPYLRTETDLDWRSFGPISPTMARLLVMGPRGWSHRLQPVLLAHRPALRAVERHVR